MTENKYAEVLRKMIEGGYDLDPNFVPNLLHPELLYQGMDFTGEIRTCHGPQQFLEFCRGFAPLCSKSTDEVLATKAIGSDTAMIHIRGHRKLRYTGEEVSYEAIMIARFQDGKLKQGADMPEQKGCDAWRRAWLAMNESLLKANPHEYTVKK